MAELVTRSAFRLFSPSLNPPRCWDTEGPLIGLSQLLR